MNRLLAFFSKRRLDAELDREMAAHIEMAIEDNRRLGMPEAEARRQALAAFGGRDAAREQQRDARSLPWLETLVRDLRYAMRGLRRDKAFAIVAAATIALGIGASTAVYSVVNALLLRSLPVAHGPRLVWIANTNPDGLSGRTFRIAAFEEFRRGAASFDGMTGYFAFFGFNNEKMTGRGEPERLQGVGVEERFFDVLGVQPALGRFFTAAECVRGGPRAMVLTHGFWTRRFAADPRIVGRTLTLDNTPVAVVGIAPASFDFAAMFAPGARVDYLKPQVLDAIRRQGNTLSIVGRLRPGATIGQARQEFAALLPRLEAANPELRNAYHPRLTPLSEHLAASIRRPLILLWAAVGLVMLVVCFNLANLQLARTSARQREFAIRDALGAGRGRLLAQLFAEGCVLALLGLAGGLALAQAFPAWLSRQERLGIPLLDSVRIDLPAVLYAAGMALAVALLFGLAPLAGRAGGSLADSLKDRARGAALGQVTFRRWLVGGQVAVTCVLLCVAGLIARSFLHVLGADLGFQPSQAAAMRLDFPEVKNREQASSYLEEVRRRVLALPGIEAAGMTDALPLDGNRSWCLAAVGGNYKRDEDIGALITIVDPGYVSAMRLPLRAGRNFDERDQAKSKRVLLINESAARRHWPGRSPVGQLANFCDGNPTPAEVIGVVADVRNQSIEGAPGVQMYRPFSQQGEGAMDLLFRTRGDLTAAARDIRTALLDINPNLPVTGVRPLAGLVERAASPRRFVVTLLGGFAGLALLLASLGIYGVVSYSVAQRSREIAVRLALGATPGAVRWSVLSDSLRLTGAGLAAGVAAAIGAARLVESQLYGVTPSDWTAYAAAIGVLLLVSLAAALLPAWWASRIEAASALRS